MTSLRSDIAHLTARLPDLADPSGPDALLALLRLLHGVGRRDLPLGRLFEGHVDALQIVHRYGSAEQRAAAAAAARAGAAFGVWNADLPGDALRLGEHVLSGGKAFASGAGILTHALVTVDADGGRQLLLLDLERTPPAIDRDWWRTTGMSRSETHLVRWSEAPVRETDRIGAPGDYVREPWFSGGALRFAAVQAGGIAGLLDRVRAHLLETGRAGDPHQQGRLADLHLLSQAANGTVREAAAHHFIEGEAAALARVSVARAQVYAAADAALTLAQQAVGLQGFFLAHPLAAMMTDLAVYIRQPAPDAQRMRVGAAVADGLLEAAL